MPGENTRTEDCLWLLGSLCNLYRIPFDAALVASQFPPPYTLATFHEAARALGFKTGSLEKRGRSPIMQPRYELALR